MAALNLSVLTWTEFMSAYGLVTKFGLFLIQYGTMRFIGARRRRRLELLASDPSLATQG